MYVIVEDMDLGIAAIWTLKGCGSKEMGIKLIDKRLKEQHSTR